MARDLDEFFRVLEHHQQMEEHRLEVLNTTMQEGFDKLNSRLRSLELWRAAISGAVVFLGVLWVVGMAVLQAAR